MGRTKASTAQLSYLSEYMSAHSDMALGHLAKSLQGRLAFEQKWSALATKLNALGGPIKTVGKWKQAWRDLRNNIKKKAVYNKNENGPTSICNGPSTVKEHEEVEEQVVSLIGPVAVYRMKDVPVTEHTTRKKSTSPSPEPSHIQLSPPLPMTGHKIEADQSPVLSAALNADNLPTDVIHSPTSNSRHGTRKRRRIAKIQDSFNTKLLKIEEEKIKIEKARNTILENKNAVLNKLVDVLQEIADKLK